MATWRTICIECGGAVVPHEPYYFLPPDADSADCRHQHAICHNAATVLSRLLGIEVSPGQLLPTWQSVVSRMATAPRSQWPALYRSARALMAQVKHRKRAETPRWSSALGLH